MADVFTVKIIIKPEFSIYRDRCLLFQPLGG